MLRSLICHVYSDSQGPVQLYIMPNAQPLLPVRETRETLRLDLYQLLEPLASVSCDRFLKADTILFRNYFTCLTNIRFKIVLSGKYFINGSKSDIRHHVKCLNV